MARFASITARTRAIALAKNVPIMLRADKCDDWTRKLLRHNDGSQQDVLARFESSRLHGLGWQLTFGSLSRIRGSRFGRCVIPRSGGQTIHKYRARTEMNLVQVRSAAVRKVSEVRVLHNDGSRGGIGQGPASQARQCY